MKLIDPHVTYTCKTGEHDWLSKEEAHRCCNGWIAVWIPGLPGGNPNSSSRLRYKGLVEENDSESLSKYKPVLGYRDDPNYVDPLKRNLIMSDSDMNLNFSSAYREIPLFLMKGLPSSPELVSASDTELLSAAGLFFRFANTIKREKIRWRDVDYKVVEKYIESNSPFSDEAANRLRNVFKIWCSWFESFLEELKEEDS